MLRTFKVETHRERCLAFIINGHTRWPKWVSIIEGGEISLEQKYRS